MSPKPDYVSDAIGELVALALAYEVRRTEGGSTRIIKQCLITAAATVAAVTNSIGPVEGISPPPEK